MRKRSKALRVNSAPAKLEKVGKVIVSQLGDGRAVISVHGETVKHYLAQVLFCSQRNGVVSGE